MDDSSSLDRLRLSKAYDTPFLGEAATEFLKHLEKKEADVIANEIFAIAKLISVVQSSGTGKSRMLTEVGKRTFTLPICLRDPDAPGYPPTDIAVFRYFRKLFLENVYGSTKDIACFLAACHTKMLAWLEKKHREGLDKPGLLNYWHGIMERYEEPEGRKRFFSEVITEAEAIRSKMDSPGSKRIDEEPNIEAFARNVYREHTKKATEDLVNFLSEMEPKGPPSVTYIDESENLGSLFWTLLRLLSKQHDRTPMWYVFMDTKSSIDYFKPASGASMHSLRLIDELRSFILPYVALGFDQNMIFNSGVKMSVTVGELQSLGHVSQYGRPLWCALLLQGDNLVVTARKKLTNDRPFSCASEDHVLAVLSQRLCVDIALTSSEGIALADRSVSTYTRLVIDISSERRGLLTHAPTEPVLVLAAASMIYEQPNRWGPILNTFRESLCEPGLVEEGFIGEFGLRLLLLIARDFTAPKQASSNERDLLKPVLLMGFLDRLFGKKTWCSDQDRTHFQNAFHDTYVNFTHWIISKDVLPEAPDRQLLANLYARGGALQCSFHQDSLDLLIPTYNGPFTESTLFGSAEISAIVIQMKYKGSGHESARKTLRPIGIPDDHCPRLPYLVLLVELDTESLHEESHSKILVKASDPSRDDVFQKLKEEWVAAVEILELYRQIGMVKGKVAKEEKAAVKEKKAAVEEARLAMDSYNRYVILIHGASPDTYGILREAKIVDEFAKLLKVISPSPFINYMEMQHMRPTGHLGPTSFHTDWMVDLFEGSEDENDEGGSDGPKDSEMDTH